MDGRKNNKGTKGNKGGRPPRATEEQICLALKPYEKKFLDAMERGLIETQGWAVKIFAEYYWGKPKERVEISGDDKPTNITFQIVHGDEE